MTKEIAPTKLYAKIAELLQAARQSVVRTVNQTMVHTYFEVGRMIVEDEQQGKERAEYGKNLLPLLSVQLTQEFGKGFSERNLEYMRKFYKLYCKRVTEISQKASAKFNLSWSHYVFLLGISNQDSRKFYEIESYGNNEEMFVKKRGGKLAPAPHTFIDMKFRDDTELIGARIKENDFERIGREILEKIPIGAHLLVRAMFWNGMRYAFVKKWKVLNPEDFKK